MPVDLLIYPNMRRCLVRYSGALTADEVKAGMLEQATSGVWYLPTLVDLTDATPGHIGFADMQNLAECLRKLQGVHGPRGPVAIFAVADLTYCTARMYAMAMAIATGMRCAAFRTFEDADRWLCQQCPRPEGMPDDTDRSQ